MGRPERPVDPTGGPAQLFAHELRKLRREAGLTYRELARRSGSSVTALSEAAGGERLPTLRVTLAYAKACGGDPHHWERLWRMAARDLAGELGQEANPPYLGLAMYEAANADRFFGRERLTEELLEQLRRHRFLGVFGPSGSGKSSLLRAGVVPAVLAGRLGTGWDVRVMTPGPNPVRRLSSVRPSAGNPLLLVVDQFEEVFTLCQDTEERARFVETLVTAHEARVIVGVRADFYGRCAEYPELIRVLRDGSTLVRPLTPEELRDVIVKPASREGLVVEPGLVATIIHDVGSEPGALPQVSHALLETWRQRRGKALTLTGYQAVGGLHRAIARTAEQIFSELTHRQQELARAIFLRLVALGEGTDDTRRRVDRSEIVAGHEADAAVLLERLAQARLVTLDEGTVEVAHEALIGAWPRLAGWLSEDREGLRLHRRLSDAAALWEELGRDPGALYRGTQFLSAQGWAAREGHGAHLTPGERAFLAASAAESAARAGGGHQALRLRVLIGLLAAALALSLAVNAALWRS